MISQISQPRLKGYRFPRSIISYAVWAYHRFALSLRDVEDLLAERGIKVSYETIRSWVRKFGTQIAKHVRAARQQPSDKWHLDELVIIIRGVKHWLWRAVDSNGAVLDILVQSRRNARAAKRFIARLVARWGTPRVIVTDKLRSYGAALRKLALEVDHRAHKGINNRIEGPCCTNQLRDSFYESSVVAGGYEQLVPYEVQDQELAFVQHGAKAARFAINLV